MSIQQLFIIIGLLTLAAATGVVVRIIYGRRLMNGYQQFFI